MGIDVGLGALVETDLVLRLHVRDDEYKCNGHADRDHHNAAASHREDELQIRLRDDPGVRRTAGGIG